MKVSIETKQTVEIEVEFPCFKKHGAPFYKLMADGSMIEVSADPEDLKIRTGKLSYWGLVLKDGINIQESSFEAAFENVHERIGKLILQTA